MKTRTIVSTFLLTSLFACGTDKENEQATQQLDTLNQDTSLIVRPNNNINTTATTLSDNPKPIQDTIIIKESFNETDVAINDYLTTELKSIRDNFKKLNSITDWTTTDKRKLEKTPEDGVAEYYYLHGKLQKIIARYPQGKTYKLTEYYLLNGQLSFVIEKGIESQDEYSELIIDKSYFINKKLAHKIESQDCGAPFATDYLRNEEKRIADNYTNMISRLNK